jgi:RNA polymerase sigma-70 factor, ECF subfamily
MGVPIRNEAVHCTDLTPALDEHALVERIRSGDAAAFEQLVRAFAAGLVSFAYSRVGSIEIAEDIVQDVMLGIWSHRDEWQPQHSLKTYLYHAVQHRASNYHRHLRVEDSYRDELAREFNSLDHPASPDQADLLLTTGEFECAVGAALDSLPPRTREVFVMSREGNFTYREIALALGITVKTVEFHMARALAVFREKLVDWRADS